MSEERKSIGAGKLSKVPDKRLRLTIGDGAVKTEHIANGAITSQKISSDAVQYITADVQNQIDSIQIGGWAISNQLGDDPHIGISQKTLTELIGYDSTPDSIRGRIKENEDRIQELEGDYNDCVKNNEKGVPSGIATLDINGKVPQAQLPSYVDDVLDGYFYNNAFYTDENHTQLLEAETGKIYVDVPTKVSYRYSGSAYVAISNPYFPDEEDLTVSNDIIKFKDKAYSAASYSGLGRKYLRKNMVGGVNTLTQEMVNSANTEYVVQYDFVLGSDIALPSNCVLKFDGGSFNGSYTLTGANTVIDSADVAIFNDGIIIGGTWNCPKITSKWIGDVTSDNRIKQVFNLADSTINNDIVIEEDDYSVTADYDGYICLSIPSNTDVTINGNITLAPNSYGHYTIISIKNAENVYLHGKGVISGDVENHTGTTGEWGNGLDIITSKDIYVEGLTFEKCWGDGIYIGSNTAEATIGDTYYASKRIQLNNVKCDSNRRQGMSIVHVDGVHVTNSSFVNTGRIEYTAPGAGIDVEPNVGNGWNQSSNNVSIVSCNFNNNYSYAVAAFSVLPEYCNNITVRDCQFNNSSVTNSGSTNMFFAGCKGISRMIIGGSITDQDAVHPKTYVNNSEFSYIYLSGSSPAPYGEIYVNNCIIGGENPYEVLLYKLGDFREKVRISNSVIRFTTNLQRELPYYDTEIRDSDIIQTNQESVTYGCMMRDIVLINNRIDVYRLYPTGTYTAKLIGNIIKNSSTSLFYIWDFTSLYLRRNIILNEESTLFANIHALTNLYIEEKLTTSQDNVSSYSAKITNLTNRIEHFE